MKKWFFTFAVVIIPVLSICLLVCAVYRHPVSSFVDLSKMQNTQYDDYNDVLHCANLTEDHMSASSVLQVKKVLDNNSRIFTIKHGKWKGHKYTISKIKTPDNETKYLFMLLDDTKVVDVSSDDDVAYESTVLVSIYTNCFYSEHLLDGISTGTKIDTLKQRLGNDMDVDTIWLQDGRCVSVKLTEDCSSVKCVMYYDDYSDFFKVLKDSKDFDITELYKF